MRALLPVALLLVLAAPAPVAAHTPPACAWQYHFPSAAVVQLPPGTAVVFLLPSGQFGTISSAVPVDVTMLNAVAEDECAVDERCHVHGMVGALACGTPSGAFLEVRNSGASVAHFAAAIGLCVMGVGCEGALG